MRDLLARNPRYFQASPDAENFTSKLAAKVDRHPGRTFAVLTIAYLLVAFTLSSFKLLWLDELITLHIARLSGLGTIWRALTQGADPNPPVTYVLVHWSRQLFGDHEFAYRIPAICGYWIGIASLYFYLRRHLTGSWAIFGCIVSMSMGAFNYSFESRSYALLYGLAMLAFFFWTVHANARHAPAKRWAGLIGMVVALAAGISTNYFSVLAFLPPAVGELVLTILRMRGKFGAAIQLVRLERLRGSLSLRGIDLRVWLGFAIAAAPLLAYKPLIEHSIAQFAPYAWNRVSLNQVFDSYTEMVEVILYPILGIFLAGVVVLFTRERVFAICEECRSGFLPEWAEGIYAHSRARLSIPVHEAAGVFVFLCYPICGYIVASIRGGMLSPRFVIPVCFGFAIAAAMVTHYLFHNVRHAATVALCIACGGSCAEMPW